MDIVQVIAVNLILDVLFTGVVMFYGARLVRHAEKEGGKVGNKVVSQLEGLNDRLDDLLSLQELALRRQVSAEQRQAVCRFLTGLPSIFFGDKARRDRLLDDLPLGLVSRLQRSDSSADDLTVMVYGSASWSNEAFTTLLDNVERALDSSADGIAFRELRKVNRLA